MTQDDAPNWDAQLAATVAAEVRRRRKELGMSAQDLADACEQIGYPVPRNVIANMESGRRTTLPLPDVMVLAEALDTNPICLLYPVGYAETAPMLPDRDPVNTWTVLSWFTGEQNTGNGDALSLYRLHQAVVESAQRATGRAQDHRRQAADARDPGERAEALRSAEQYEQRAHDDHAYLGRIRAALREDALLLPQLPLGLDSIDDSPPTVNSPEDKDK
ncbi:helix-turn-helix domain-containing protein [Streptomyces polygonati]|uniref:Helix-turn-helix domain-containing protein n=1 Tax=Streptomyces polygonati TaxID=1617087 RepID=A0ABV8HNX1_9ACTN